MKFSQIISRLDGSIWAIEPGKLKSIVAFLNVRLSGVHLPQEEIEEAAGQRRRPLRQVKGGVGVLPVMGTLVKGASELEKTSGVSDPVDIGQQFDAMMADDSIGAIVLQVDSPGGIVFGIRELSDKIFNARGQGKRILSVVDGFGASAAYDIASAAEEVIVSPSSLSGSIGVYSMHLDVSGYEAKEGIKTTLVSAGKFKVEGNPFEPLGDEARASMQSEVNKFYDKFVHGVARNRAASVSDVRGGFGEGRVLTAEDAVRERLADRIGTLEEVIGTLTGRSKPGPKADVRRRRLELMKKSV